MLPAFEIVARRRPVAIVGVEGLVGEVGAPYVAVQSALAGSGEVSLRSGDDRATAVWEGETVRLEITAGGRTTRHRSRRDGRPFEPPEALGLTLTGVHVTALTRSDGVWTARARENLTTRVDTRDEQWLAGLRSEGQRAGAFGQLGLRDLRLVSEADGTPVRDGDLLLLSATSAGPGFFDTAHTSIWSLDPATYDLEHRADLFFRRPGRAGIFGDHATHVTKYGERWLVATSTWGDFDPRVRGASVAVTLAETTADVTHGRHVLDTRLLPLPTTGLRSVGVWDPHLVRADEGWLVAYVSATRFFRFHPVLATGPTLDDLTLRASVDRPATEGPTLVRIDGAWHLAASDGRDSPAGLRERYPVFDLDLREIDTLSATYPTNIPWPTLAPLDGGWLMVGFDGTSYGGRLAGYGTHGDVVIQRSRSVRG